MKNLFAKILTVSAFCVLVFGCKKSDSKGKLYLSLKSVNGKVFNNLDPVVFIFEFSHPKSEDVSDKLLVKRKFVNCTSSPTFDTISIPEFTSTADFIGTFEFAFRNGDATKAANPCYQPPSGYKTDSLTYTFWLQDKDGNKTDSVVSPQITLKK
jgi:hypothetical protein